MPELPLGNVVGPQGPQGPKGDKGDKGDTGTFDPADLQRITNLENGKVDKVTGKTLSTNDYTDADKAAVETIGNKVDKVTGKGLSTNDYTDADKAAVETIGNKVDKVTGKALSTNDYTDADKTKLSGIEAQANKTTIDSTLSNTGQAADAKSTGDKIAALYDLISRMEIYCEASGTPATFSDAKAANVKELSVTLTPTQSGSGDPYPPGGGPNILDLRNGNGGTAAGVTFSRNADGSYAMTGTQSGDVNNVWFQGSYRSSATIYTLLAGHTYLISDCALFYVQDARSLSPGTHTLSNDIAIGGVRYVYIPNDPPGRTYNTTIYPMVLDLTAFPNADSSGATWYPYENIRPISGVSSVTVTRTGENGANPQSVTVALVNSNSDPLTVYGGTLDVTAGTLSVTWANIASYNGETLPGRWISDRDVYVSGATPTTGAQVVYELATPVTYQLTPQQLATLHGYNAVSADAGNVAVTYKADTSLVWG